MAVRQRHRSSMYEIDTRVQRHCYWLDYVESATALSVHEIGYPATELKRKILRDHLPSVAFRIRERIERRKYRRRSPATHSRRSPRFTYSLYFYIVHIAVIWYGDAPLLKYRQVCPLTHIKVYIYEHNYFKFSVLHSIEILKLQRTVNIGQYASQV